jgi:hypothetical protein
MQVGLLTEAAQAASGAAEVASRLPHQQETGLQAGGSKQQASSLSGTAAAAAAQWQQHGDLGQLVNAAMQLSGLRPLQAESTVSTGAEAGAVGPSSEVHCFTNGQQHKQQQPALNAAARVQRLAPWLELLAAAAEEPQPIQHSSSLLHQDMSQALPDQQQLTVTDEIAQTDADTAAVSSQLRNNLTATAVLSAQLQRQRALESQGCLVEGILVVQHQQVPAQQQQQRPAARDLQQQQQQVLGQQSISSMQLLTPGQAATALSLPQHTIRLSCNLKIPHHCWHHSGCDDEAQADTRSQDAPATSTAAAAAAAALALTFVADVLQAGMPAALSRQVVLALPDASCQGSVQLQSFKVLLTATQQKQQTQTQANAALSYRSLKCTWLLHDDVLAQQCLSLLQLAVTTAAAD